MGIAIDIFIVLFMMLSIFIGYKRGLIKVGIRLFALIIALLLTIILYKPIARVVMDKTQLDENISNTIYLKISDKDFNNISDQDKKENKLLLIGEDYIKQAIDEKKSDVARFVSDSLAVTIVELAIFISLLIVLRILLIIMNLLADFIGNLPIIKQFNKAGGFVVGLLEGIVIIYAVFAICFLLDPFAGNGNIGKTIQSSTLGVMIYDNNIIVNKIAK
jgi:uncharacterized membrane protein required for colicin V production